MGAEFSVDATLHFATAKALAAATATLDATHPLLNVAPPQAGHTLRVSGQASTTLTHAAAALEHLTVAAKKATAGVADLVEAGRGILLRVRPGRPAVELPIMTAEVTAASTPKHIEPVRDIAMHGTLLALLGGRGAGGPHGGSVVLWDVSDPTAARFITRLGEFSGSGKRLAFSHDGTRLAVAGGSTLDVWDVAERRPIARGKIGEYRHMSALVWAPDDALLLVQDEKGPNVFDPASGKRRHVVKGAERSADWLSPKTLVACSYKATKGTRLFAHDLETGEQRELPCPANLEGPNVYASADGQKLLLVASRGGAVVSASSGRVACAFPNTTPRFYYGAWRSKTAVAYTLPSAVVVRGKSADALQLGTKGGYHDPMCVSPDGQALIAFVDGALLVAPLT
jgi:WD40 repeat protein